MYTHTHAYRYTQAAVGQRANKSEGLQRKNDVDVDDSIIDDARRAPSTVTVNNFIFSRHPSMSELSSVSRSSTMRRLCDDDGLSASTSDSPAP